MKKENYQRDLLSIESTQRSKLERRKLASSLLVEIGGLRNWLQLKMTID